MTDIRTDELPDGFRGIFRTDIEARSLYAEGAGIARALPSAVAVPADIDDLSLLVRWARSTGHGLMPRGSGSGMAAGAVGSHVMLDVSRMQDMRAVDTSTRTVRVGAGVLRNDVDAAARRVGLCFPVDPSSGAFCTIGGMTATNAAGARTLRYGATREWVHGMHCVFDDGSAAWIRRDEPLPVHIPAVARLAQSIAQIGHALPPDARAHAGVRKESSGYCLTPSQGNEPSLLDVLVGSEGTLAIFTDVELRLTPIPAATSLLLATFDSLDKAALCAVMVAHEGASACEMLDRTYLDVAERASRTGIDASAQAVLFIEVDATTPTELTDAVQRMQDIVRRSGAASIATAATDIDSARMWQLRHAASPTLARLPASTRSMQFIEDGCVPPERFADYVRGVRAALQRADTVGVIFGHAGDAHAHVNPLIDLTRSTWRDTIHRLFNDVCDLTSTLGGTLAGEHGDGRLRAPFLERSWGTPAHAAFMNLKAAADPSGILNPGCKIASPGADPFESIRYDPSLPPLPGAARARLDAIEQQRAWHTFRLAGTQT